MTVDLFSFKVPRLTTDRLLLRELRPSDFDAYVAHTSDPVAMRFTDGVIDRRTAWRIFAAQAGGWALTGAGWWAVEHRETGECVGSVGAFFRETQLPLGPDAELELGWGIYRAHWRKGFAREAAAAMLAYVLQRHTIARAIAHIDHGNTASVAVSKAIGMRYERDVDFYGQAVQLFVVEPSRP